MVAPVSSLTIPNLFPAMKPGCLHCPCTVKVLTSSFSIWFSASCSISAGPFKIRSVTVSGPSVTFLSGTVGAPGKISRP